MRLNIREFSAEELESVRIEVSRRIHRDVPELKPNPNPGCATFTFVAKDADGELVFVKLADPAVLRKTRAVHSLCADLEFIPRVLDDGEFAWREYGVLCTEFRAAENVRPDKMNEAQIRSLVEVYLSLYERLQGLSGALDSKVYALRLGHDGALRRLLGRSIIARILLKDLVAVLSRGEGNDRRLLRVVHGDFHPGNCGFDGDRVAVVYDLDNVGMGLPAYELGAIAFARDGWGRFSGERRRRLTESLTFMMERAGWSEADWLAGLDLVHLVWAFSVVTQDGPSVRAVWKLWRRGRGVAQMKAYVSSWFDRER